MGDPRGFLKVERQMFSYRPVCERIKDYKEVCVLGEDKCSEEQASRCMDCGVPFCHMGCSIGNYISEWNDAVFHSHWGKAIKLLSATNNLPEITGRVCPALCEYACVLGINNDPVTIRENELAIIEYAFEHGLIKPIAPKKRTGKKIAVVGSGPAGLSCADQLNKAGHNVTVYEKDDKIGGILRYGIPDFKLEKWILDRRINLFKKEGIKFVTNVNVGVDLNITELKKEFDVICVAGGSRVPRDIKIEGRELKGIYFAMDYLKQSNTKVAGKKIPKDELIDAKDKKVVVMGGGDTGSDCVGTANRQGAKCVIQIEVLAKPSLCRTKDFPWPKYPMLLKVTSSHEEGADRQWAVLTKKFIGENGNVSKISCVSLDFSQKDEKGCSLMKEIPGSEFTIDADMVLLAVGFLHPEHNGLLKELGVEFDQRGNVKTDRNNMTTVKNVFAAGDMRRGQSLVVWAISEGREAAAGINKYLAKAK